MTADQARAFFRDRFGRDPAVVASAPGRVNLIGEHTDYNGGRVLPMAIRQRTYVALGTGSGTASRAVSANQTGEGKFTAGAARTGGGGWWDYVAGTVAALAPHLALPAAVDVAVMSDVPVGAGLSSSAALEVATAFALRALAGGDVAPTAEALAKASHAAETDYVGVPCGIMDQYASALCLAGHALHIACDTAQVTQVPMPFAVMIFDTAAPRSLRSSHYEERREECREALRHLRIREPSLEWLAQASPELLAQSADLPATIARRARHVVTETRRVGAFVDIIARDPQTAGGIMLDAHASARDDYECSTPALDWFVERMAHESGVFGARLTGAGWGGCAIALGETRALERLAPIVTAEFSDAFATEPHAWVTQASEGARVDWTSDAPSVVV